LSARLKGLDRSAHTGLSPASEGVLRATMAAQRGGRTPGDSRSPYGIDGEVGGGQLLRNLVTPIRWGIGGITKTVRE
jgi:hypothetical protein